MDPVRRLTRRELVIRAAAASGALALAACTPPATNTTQTVQPSPSLAIRRGGTVTWAQWDKNDDLDPATPTGAASLEILGNVLDTLILLDGDQKIYPLLATDWSSDGRYSLCYGELARPAGLEPATPGYKETVTLPGRSDYAASPLTSTSTPSSRSRRTSRVVKRSPTRHTAHTATPSATFLPPAALAWSPQRRNLQDALAGRNRRRNTGCSRDSGPNLETGSVAPIRGPTSVPTPPHRVRVSCHGVRCETRG